MVSVSKDDAVEATSRVADIAVKTALTTLTASGKPKEKRRNNEKRKEKSRDAARCRRSRETEIFSDMAQVLPLNKEDVNQLDKASVMRIAIAYLKVREMLLLFPKIRKLTADFKIDVDDVVTISPKSIGSGKMPFDFLKSVDTSELKQALNGFLIILSNDGDVTYASDNITEYLGIAKVDILGHQIWEYSHQCDHSELREALNIKRNGNANKVKDEQLLEEKLFSDRRELFVRFKCTLTSRGRTINIKSASYKVIHITGQIVLNGKGGRVLVGIGRPIPHPSNIEIPLGTTTFLTKHTTDMKFTYVDDKMSALLGYSPRDLLGKSFFDYHHGADSDSLMSTFKTVFSKGQGETCRYRFLGKTGGFCWIMTQATLLCDKLKPQSVVCVNYVISNLENNYDIYSLAQYEASRCNLEGNNENANSSRSFSEGNSLVCNKKQQEHAEASEEDSTVNLADENHNTNNSNKNIKCEGDHGAGAALKSFQAPNGLATTVTTVSEGVRNHDHTLSNDIDSHLADSSTQYGLQNLRLNARNDCSAPLSETKPALFLPSAAAIAQPVKHPKSVTASVFRPVPASKSLNVITKTLNKKLRSAIPPLSPPPSSSKGLSSSVSTEGQPILANSTQRSPLTFAPRTQSVTASVLTPISSLPSKQQHKLLKVGIVTAAISSAPQQHQQQLLFKHAEVTSMNKGFLSFAEDATELTMLKEEPDNLGHLTSTADDACVPLDEASPLFGEMLTGLLPYDTLLQDDINSLDSNISSSKSSPAEEAQKHAQLSGTYTKNSNDDNNLSSNSAILTSCSTKLPSSNCFSSLESTGEEGLIDPFINYREESNDTIGSQHLLSPSMASKSPEASSLPSLCSPNSLSQEDEFAFMTMNVDDDIDLTMRAPYIPMNEQDDLPLLTVDDLMWCGGSTFASEELNLNKDDVLQYDVLKQQMRPQEPYHQHLQKEQLCSNRNASNVHQEEQSQQELNQRDFHNSLYSPPASTASLLSQSPISANQQQREQEQCDQNELYEGSQQNAPTSRFTTESSELPALLCDDSDAFVLSNANDFGGGGEEETVVCFNDSDNCVVADENIMSLTQRTALNADDFILQSQKQRREKQQGLMCLGIDCKKKKFENGLPELCNSVGDTFENVYSKKDSANLECWNELLQINASVASSSTVAKQHSTQQVKASPQRKQQEKVNDNKQQECKQQIRMQQIQQAATCQPHIIKNAAEAKTLHLPLITIHNNKSILIHQQLPPCLDAACGRAVKLNDAMAAADGAGNGEKITRTSLLNTTAVVSSTPPTTADTLSAADNKSNKAASVLAAVMQQQQCNKRHLSAAAAGQQMDAKRLKNFSITTAAESHTSPHLLQQLVFPLQHGTATDAIEKVELQQQQCKVPSIAAQQWADIGIFKTTPKAAVESSQQNQQQQSNSVLKNLLISGCDDPSCQDIDVISPKPTQDQKILFTEKTGVPMSLRGRNLSTFISPLSVATTASRAAAEPTLFKYRRNPMIGGYGVQPSLMQTSINPPVPQLLLANDADSTCDSGFDEISITESTAALPAKSATAVKVGDIIGGAGRNFPAVVSKGVLEQSVKNRKVSKKGANRPSNTPPPRELVMKKSERSGSEGKAFCSLQPTVAVISNNNQLLTPFLMDLCNDDYNMHTEDLLEDSVIGNVLSEWTNELD